MLGLETVFPIPKIPNSYEKKVRDREQKVRNIIIGVHLQMNQAAFLVSLESLVSGCQLFSANALILLPSEVRDRFIHSRLFEQITYT